MKKKWLTQQKDFSQECKQKMLKKKLRVKYKELRKKLTESDINQKSIAIVEHIGKHIDLSNKVVSVFLPIQKHKEVNTYFLLDYMKEKGLVITAPKSDFKTITLTHILIEKETQIEVNNFGIPEPLSGKSIDISALDIVFVPFLAVDKNGYRVGYGKGFYDRFLSQCKNSCIFIGLHLFESFEQIDDIHESDIPVHLIISPNKITYFDRH